MSKCNMNCSLVYLKVQSAASTKGVWTGSWHSTTLNCNKQSRASISLQGTFVPPVQKTVVLFKPRDVYIFEFLYTERQQHLPVVTHSQKKLQKSEGQKFPEIPAILPKFTSGGDNGMHTLTFLKHTLFSEPIFVEAEVVVLFILRKIRIGHCMKYYLHIISFSYIADLQGKPWQVR